MSAQAGIQEYLLQNCEMLRHTKRTVTFAMPTFDHMNYETDLSKITFSSGQTLNLPKHVEKEHQTGRTRVPITTSDPGIMQDPVTKVCHHGHGQTVIVHSI
jgi:hypothetical protein